MTCNADAPGWERVYRTNRGKGIEFLGIGLKDSKEACQAFVRKHGLSFPNAYDGAGKVAQAYGFSYQPYWAVADRSGTLLRAGFGPASEQELVNTVRALVK